MEINDILKKLQEEVERGNIHSEDEMNAFLGKMMSKHNNAPREDAEGLTPQQLHQLLGLLFQKGTLITLNPNIPDELALTSPFLRMCMHILNAIPDDKPLKLTATGALPRWLVQEVYQTGVLPEYFIERGFQSLQKELDWFQLHLARVICEIAGLARQGKGKDRGKWILTRLGKKLRNKPAALLETLFLAWYNQFNWGFLDYYSSETAAQLGFGYTLYLLHQYGESHRNVHFYAQKFKLAFPMAADDFDEVRPGYGEKYLCDCYNHRTFNRSLYPFGLVELKTSGKRLRDDYTEEVCTTPLFNAFIVCNPSLTDQPMEEEPEDEELFDEEFLQLLLESPESPFGVNPVSSLEDPFYTPIRIEKTAERNDPCPCGSGRKYKKCCLQ
jgi:hypothetical protein